MELSRKLPNHSSKYAVDYCGFKCTMNFHLNCKRRDSKSSDFTLHSNALTKCKEKFTQRKRLSYQSRNEAYFLTLNMYPKITGK